MKNKYDIKLERLGDYCSLKFGKDIIAETQGGCGILKLDKYRNVNELELKITEMFIRNFYK
jgi:hypothetical protein